MALRLNELVCCGELLNTRLNSVHGYLGLRGFERPLVFELTGNCAADLAGRHIRFEVRNPPEPADEEPLENEDARLTRLELTGLAWRQIGPTGTMTAARKVRVADCPPEELYARCKLGEPPPTTWARCLYLEWFSQNGRVVLELVDPVIEVVEPEPVPGAGERVAPLDPPLDEDVPETMEGGLGITSIHLNADGDVEARDETPAPDELEDSPEGPDDPYGLIPDDLQRELDAQARATDQALHEDAESAEVIREMELMDECIERGEGEPVGTLFDGPVTLRRPEQLDDQEAEQELKVLLARLALHGVALDMCEHFTAADAYRLLVERICPEERAYAELRGTQWVQHFSTWEFCPVCLGEDAPE